MSREADAARARSEAAQAAKLLAAIETAVGDALADCTDADASEGYKALLADAPRLRHAIAVNTEDLARENGFTYPRGERATRNLDAVRAMLRTVEAYDPDEYAVAKRRERADRATREAAQVAALVAADQRLIAARAEAYYDGLRADGARLDSEIKAARETFKAVEAERAAAYSVVHYEAARDSDARHTAAAYERARLARLAHCETESL